MPTKPTCSSCAHFHGIDETCHFNPPSVSVVMVPDMETESFTPQTLCAFPTTRRAEWCSKHEEPGRILTLQ